MKAFEILAELERLVAKQESFTVRGIIRQVFELGRSYQRLVVKDWKIPEGKQGNALPPTEV